MSNEESVWIPNSHSFSKNVIDDTIAQLRGGSQAISAAEKLGLSKLKKLWVANYKPKDRQPLSNPVPLPPKPKRKPRPRKRATAASKKVLKDDEYVDATTLEDNCDVVYGINIPPLRPNWQCRSFKLKVKAHVCKNNLVEPLINWQLLDTIMEVPLDEGTSIFQKHVDEMLEKDLH
ncbi:moonshiner [Drosophila sulfurigaster albostrigata]|uniref:moonshiner n=1 Tax=Drosophila sulfurigaster albostrigata TaxID=89887 RepID=UPI002D21A24E|nr:moonshiner [Drosophila sulfurigaster albostrigata]